MANPWEFLQDDDAQADVRERLHGLLGAAGDGEFWRDTLTNGTDTLNSDVIGGLLGAPVDLVNLATRVDEPLLGKGWWTRQMQRAGMVSPAPIGLLGPSQSGS